MLATQTTDCWAKEAESLEQAKRFDDEDLRHLYETIAKQWHLLAERTENRRAKVGGAAPCANAAIADCANAAVVADVVEASSDTTGFTSVESLSSQHLDADPFRAQVTRDNRAEQDGANAIAIGQEQILEPMDDGALVSTNLEDDEVLWDQTSDTEDHTQPTKAALCESRGDQHLESLCENEEFSADSTNLADIDDQSLESETGHRGRFESLDGPMPETETACHPRQVIVASEGIDDNEHRISGAANSTVPARAETNLIQNVGQISADSQSVVRQTARRLGSPLEWILSCWVGQSHK
jgi:hypothetical protein